MFCASWDWDFKGVIYYEVLPPNPTISSEKYYSKMAILKAKIEEKRPEMTNPRGIVFFHDNA